MFTPYAQDQINLIPYSNKVGSRACLLSMYPNILGLPFQTMMSRELIPYHKPIFLCTTSQAITLI